MPDKITSRRKLIRGLSGVAFGGLSAGVFSSCETMEGAATATRRSSNRTLAPQQSLKETLESVTTRTSRSTRSSQTASQSGQRVGFRRLATSESASQTEKPAPASRSTSRSDRQNEPASFWSKFGRSENSRIGHSRGTRIAARAQSWVGRNYRYGQQAQCAAFVSSIVSSENVPYRAAARAFDSDAVGPRVSRKNLRPGDIVMFQRTYSSPHRITHVGIYVGEGKFVHRSTKGGSVKLSSINSSHYSPRYYTARRIA